MTWINEAKGERMISYFDQCFYPDWEGGIIAGKHNFGKDGFCCICGEKEKSDTHEKGVNLK